MNIDNIGGKYVRDQTQAFLEPISNGYNDIEGNVVSLKKKSVRKSYAHYVIMGIICAYTAAFWGARHMFESDALEAVSGMQAMTLAQELEEMQMDIEMDLAFEQDLKAKYAPKKPAYKPSAYKPSSKYVAPKNSKDYKKSKKSSYKPTYYYNKKYGKKSKDQKSSSVFAEFFAGIIMIAFALPMIWMNERKQVKMDKLYGLGREEATTISIDEPKEEELYKLAHCSGVVTTSIPVVDSTFGLEQENAIKVRRTVEVYQWIEHREEEEQEEGDPIVHYTYEKRWSSSVEGKDFGGEPDSEEEDAKTRNSTEWPFHGDTYTNEQLNMGAFKVTESQIGRMQEWSSLDISDRGSALSDAVQQAMYDKGFGPLHEDGEYLTSSADGQARVNDIRVRWEVVNCQEYTFLSQQMKNDKGEWTFRKWNPEEIESEWGNDTNQDIDVSCPMWCLPCAIVECCFKAAFDETLDVVRAGEVSIDEIFEGFESTNQCTTKCFRYMTLIMNIVGHFCLFMPIINVFSWIPFVGYFLSAILAVAAFMFALVWGTMLWLMILCVAWIVYRPLFGCLLLVGVVSMFAVMFMWPATNEDKIVE